MCNCRHKVDHIHSFFVLNGIVANRKAASAFSLNVFTRRLELLTSLPRPDRTAFSVLRRQLKTSKTEHGLSGCHRRPQPTTSLSSTATNSMTKTDAITEPDGGLADTAAAAVPDATFGVVCCCFVSVELVLVATAVLW